MIEAGIVLQVSVSSPVFMLQRIGLYVDYGMPVAVLDNNKVFFLVSEQFSSIAPYVMTAAVFNSDMSPLQNFLH